MLYSIGTDLSRLTSQNGSRHCRKSDASVNTGPVEPVLFLRMSTCQETFYPNIMRNCA